jgi:hypothetical protein
MGKKEKLKGKLKGSTAADDGGKGRNSGGMGEEMGMGMDHDGVAAANGWGSGPTGENVERLTNFGADGWGDGTQDDHQPLQWLPQDNGGTWDNPAPDISMLARWLPTVDAFG